MNNRFKLKTEKMNVHETPSDSPPAYADVSPALTGTAVGPATPPPPYALLDLPQFPPPTTPQILPAGQSTAASSSQSVHSISARLAGQPCQQHQQDQVVLSTIHWHTQPFNFMDVGLV